MHSFDLAAYWHHRRDKPELLAAMKKRVAFHNVSKRVIVQLDACCKGLVVNRRNCNVILGMLVSSGQQVAILQV